MILTKLLYFFLAFNRKGNSDKSYYKIIYHKNKKGCVESNTTQKIANTFNAKLGSCYEQNYTIFKGIYKIPFCCEVHGYECNVE